MRNANVDSYLDDDEEELTAPVTPDVFEDEDEDEVAERSSVIQVGWAAAKKLQAEASKAYANDFKFEEDVKLIRFLTSEPMSFAQHWVQRTGKKSFVCLGTPQCPLCRAGNKPENKFAFSVVNLMEEDPTVELMVVGMRLCGQFDKLNNDPKTGPLDRLFWAVSKSGKGTKTTYSVMPVKDRDLPEDWDLDVQETMGKIKKLKPLDTAALRISTKAELTEIAHEIPEE